MVSGKGINEDIVRQISKAKNEPEWMLAYRLESYRKFIEIPNLIFERFKFINFDEFTYFLRASEKSEKFMG